MRTAEEYRELVDRLRLEAAVFNGVFITDEDDEEYDQGVRVPVSTGPRNRSGAMAVPVDETETE